MPRLRCTERVRKMIKSIVFNMFRSGRALMIGCWVIEQLHLFVCLRRAWKWFFWHTAVVLSTPVGNKGQTGWKWAGNRKSNNKQGINSFRTAAFEAPTATWFMSEAAVQQLHPKMHITQHRLAHKPAQKHREDLVRSKGGWVWAPKPHVCGFVWKRMWVTAGAELLCSHFKRGVQEISSRRPPRWRRGGGGRDKGPFPNATAQAAAGQEEALNWMLSICSAWEKW